jgi:hypothetical protein
MASVTPLDLGDIKIGGGSPFVLFGLRFVLVMFVFD